MKLTKAQRETLGLMLDYDGAVCEDGNHRRTFRALKKLGLVVEVPGYFDWKLTEAGRAEARRLSK
jgi:hypothetical protein